MASRGVNKVILVGNVGQDPEVRVMPQGGAVANLSIATSDAWRDKQSGQLQERTEWHRVTFYQKLAEIVQQYVKKGSKLYIEGSLRTRKWQDKEGRDRYTTEIIAQQMQMLDSRGEGTGRSSDNNQDFFRDNNSQSNMQSHAAPSTPAKSEDPFAEMIDFDDEIPF